MLITLVLLFLIMISKLVASLTTKTIHSMLSKNLLATKGTMKITDNEVQIRKNITYKPLSHLIELESEFNFLLIFIKNF